MIACQIYSTNIHQIITSHISWCIHVCMCMLSSLLLCCSVQMMRPIVCLINVGGSCLDAMWLCDCNAWMHMIPNAYTTDNRSTIPFHDLFTVTMFVYCVPRTFDWYSVSDDRTAETHTHNLEYPVSIQLSVCSISNIVWYELEYTVRMMVHINYETDRHTFVIQTNCHEKYW